MISVSKDDIFTWVELLRGRHTQDRCMAANALAILNAEAHQAIPALIELMADTGNHRASLAALLALYSFGPAAEAALPPLLQALRHPQERHRMAAALALSKVAPATPTAIKALAVALNRDPSAKVRCAAALAFAGMLSSDPVALEALAHAERDVDKNVAVIATITRSYLSLPPHEAIPAILRAARKKQLPRRLFGHYCAAGLKTLRFYDTSFLSDFDLLYPQIADVLRSSRETAHAELFGRVAPFPIVPPRLSVLYFLNAPVEASDGDEEFLREALCHDDPVIQAVALHWAVNIVEQGGLPRHAVIHHFLRTGFKYDHLLLSVSAHTVLRHIDDDPEEPEYCAFRHEAFRGMYAPDINVKERTNCFLREPYFRGHVRQLVLNNLHSKSEVFRRDPAEYQLGLVTGLLYDELAKDRRLVSPDDYFLLSSRLANRLTWRLEDYYRDFYGMRRHSKTRYLDEEVDDWLSSRDRDPREVLEVAEEITTVRAMLDEQEWLVVYARFIERVPCEEIAFRHGLPTKLVYRITERVMKRLRRRFG
jgi:DNA-directed RNA polymerase specialized sigma24 family protein